MSVKLRKSLKSDFFEPLKDEMIEKEKKLEDIGKALLALPSDWKKLPFSSSSLINFRGHLLISHPDMPPIILRHKDNEWIPLELESVPGSKTAIALNKKGDWDVYKEKTKTKAKA